MIATQFWLSLSQETRSKLAKELEIPRSAGMEVVDNAVVSDGYTPQDLAVVTLEKLQAYMASEEKDFYKLLDQVIEKLNRVVEVEEIKQPKKK